MIRTALLAAVSLAVLAGPALAQAKGGGDAAGQERVMQILRRTPLIDGHNDLPWALRQQHGNDPFAVDLTVNLDASTGVRLAGT